MLALLGRRLGAAAAAPALAGRGIASSRAAADLREFLDPDAGEQVTYGAVGGP